MRNDPVCGPGEVMHSVMPGIDEQLVSDMVQTGSFEVVFNCEYRHFCRIVQEKFLIERLEETCIHDPAGTIKKFSDFKRRSDFAPDCPDCHAGAVPDDFGFSPFRLGHGQVVDL